MHVQEITPLLLLVDRPLQDVGQRPFEQQPFEPRSSVVEHWAEAVVAIIPSSTNSANVRVTTSVCLIRERESVVPLGATRRELLISFAQLPRASPANLHAVPVTLPAPARFSSNVAQRGRRKLPTGVTYYTCSDKDTSVH